MSAEPRPPHAVPLARDHAGRAGRLAHPSRVTSTPTWRSSAPASPACGPRYYLARADPSLRIAVLEAETAGFGASGRNGGWCSALFPSSLESLAKRSSRADALALARRDAAQRRRGDASRRRRRASTPTSPRAARSPWPASGPQLARARSEVEHARGWGRGEDELRLLDAEEATAVLAGTHAARGDVHPGLRGHPPRPPGPRARRRRRTPGGHDLRADAGHGDRAGAGDHPPRNRACRARDPCDRGLHAHRSTASAGGWCPSTR